MKPKLTVRRETRSGRNFHVIEVAAGEPPVDVVSEFQAIAQSHALVADGGGCFMQQANVLGGRSIQQFGGMYVSPEKYSVVESDFQRRGYEFLKT